MEEAEVEILERIAAGERVFRPGAPTDVAPHPFEALVARLHSLRRRGLIDLPDAEIESGASPVAGPCFLTDAGRAALVQFRQGERRGGERRLADRRRGAVELAGAERRSGERRQGDRRR